MRASYLRRGVLLALTLGAAACTEPSVAPTTPTTTTLIAPQVNGVFQGTMTLSSIGPTGGAGPLPNAGTLGCVQRQFAAAVPKDNTVSLVVSQDATRPSTVTARMTSASTGLACTYHGVIGSGNSLVLDALPAADCSESNGGDRIVFFACPDPVTGAPVPVGIELVGSSVTATFDGWPINVRAVRGTAALTYNIGDGTGFVATFGGPGANGAPPVPPFVLDKH